MCCSCSSAYQDLLSVRKCLDDMSRSDTDLAVLHWKMIEDFGHPTAFVFEEICLLWVGSLLYVFPLRPTLPLLSPTNNGIMNCGRGYFPLR